MTDPTETNVLYSPEDEGETDDPLAPHNRNPQRLSGWAVVLGRGRRGVLAGATSCPLDKGVGEVNHVIVIETVDEEAGGAPIDPKLQEVLVRALEIGIEEFHGPCCIYGRFNVSSVIATVHEMYGASKWDPETSS